jgi:uncharacterized damage-inducible protein DinB
MPGGGGVEATRRICEAYPEARVLIVTMLEDDSVILYHLVAIELSYLYEDILEQGWVPELAPLLPYDVRDEERQLTAVRGEDLQTHLRRLEHSRSLLRPALQTMTSAEWQRPRDIEGATITPEWAVHHLIQHEAEHRGQIGELRRRA